MFIVGVKIIVKSVSHTTSKNMFHVYVEKSDGVMTQKRGSVTQIAGVRLKRFK